MKSCLHSLNILTFQQKTTVFNKVLPSPFSSFITTNGFIRKYPKAMYPN